MKQWIFRLGKWAQLGWVSATLWRLKINGFHTTSSTIGKQVFCSWKAAQIKPDPCASHCSSPPSKVCEIAQESEGTIPPAEWVSPLQGIISALQIDRRLKMQGRKAMDWVCPFQETECYTSFTIHGKLKATLKKKSKAKSCWHQWHSGIQMQNWLNSGQALRKLRDLDTWIANMLQNPMSPTS